MHHKIDGIDIIILNCLVSGKGEQVAISMASIEKFTYNERVRQLEELGIDFNKIAEEVKKAELKYKYSKLSKRDFDVYNIMNDGKSVIEAAQILKLDKARVRDAVRKWTNLGVLFKDVIREQTEKEERVEQQKMKVAEVDEARAQRRAQRIEKYRRKMTEAEIMKAAKDAKQQQKTEQLKALLSARKSDGTLYSQEEIGKMMGGVSKQAISRSMKKRGISRPSKSRKPPKESTKPTTVDMDVYQMMKDGYIESEIIEEMKLTPEQIREAYERLRDAGYKFKIKRKEPIFKLDDIHKAIIRYKIQNNTISSKELAEKLGISKPAVEKRLRTLRNHHLIDDSKGNITPTRNAVRKLIDSEGRPCDSIRTIADYYGLNYKVVRGLAKYTINPKDEKER